MNRRSFFATLFAPIVARFVPKQNICDPHLTLAMDEFSAKFLMPALVPLANQIDKDIACWYVNVRKPPRFLYGGGAGCGGHVSKSELPA